MAKQPTARAGKKLGRYRIERELGRGGMGVVYLAEDENTGRLLALKTTNVAGLGGGQASRNQRRQRFVREVQALTQVNHDNVVHVIDAGEADDPDLGWLLFYSMEYVEGETLAQLVQRTGPLEPGAAAAVCMQVAAGLGAAHRAGIVHRDVKPANIFISLDSRALIGDFGICKIEGQTQITRRDQLVGTPNYLAPEQILGDPVSAATDVFALGALFYVITMNRPLRSHVDAAALLASAQGNEPYSRMIGERGVPEGLRKVVARCLERDPKKRWADGNHLADALSEFATRIPSLRDSTLHDQKKEQTSTQDRSSPFASLPDAPSDDVLEVPSGVGGFADPSSIEAAAQAFERELAQRDAQKKPQEEKALPVARTESTVMFNLRAMEEEHKDEKKPLPVARTESTAIFKMNEAEKSRPAPSLVRDETAAAAAAARLEMTSLGDDPTPVGDASDTDDSRPALVPEHPKVKAFDADARTRSTTPAFKLKLPKLPRPAWVGISGASGALFGILLVLVMAPPSRSAAKQPDPDELPLERIQAAPARPQLCPEENDKKAPTKAEHEEAAKLLRDAVKEAEAGGSVKHRRQILEKAARDDPHDPEIYWQLARVYEADGEPGLRDEAYRCTCATAESHVRCQLIKAKKFLK